MSSSATCDHQGPDPAEQKEFDAALARIMQHLGVCTQIELSEKFGIRQSSISDAKKRASIPDSWLIRLVRDHSLNPLWVMRGSGAKFLVPQDEAPLTPDFENALRNAPATMLLRVLAYRMNRPDITVGNGGAA